MTQLSANFTLDELTITSTRLPNEPTEEQKQLLQYVAQYLLQPIRDRFGRIRVTSGFRSREVNDSIGGSPNSDHMDAAAVDFIPVDADLFDVFKWCRENLRYGQLIYENKGDAWWIHISLPKLGRDNMIAMTYSNGVYTNVTV